MSSIEHLTAQQIIGNRAANPLIMQLLSQIDSWTQTPAPNNDGFTRYQPNGLDPVMTLDVKLGLFPPLDVIGGDEPHEDPRFQAWNDVGFGDHRSRDTLVRVTVSAPLVAKAIASMGRLDDMAHIANQDPLPSVEVYAILHDQAAAPDVSDPSKLWELNQIDVERINKPDYDPTTQIAISLPHNYPANEGGRREVAASLLGYHVGSKEIGNITAALPHVTQPGREINACFLVSYAPTDSQLERAEPEMVQLSLFGAKK